MFCQHSVLRMQQRGISQRDIYVLLQFGHSEFHQGREIVSFDRRSWLALLNSKLIALSECEHLRNQYVVLNGGEIVTVAHKTKHFKKDRH